MKMLFSHDSNSINGTVSLYICLSSDNSLHQTTFFVKWLSVSIYFLHQLTFFIHQLSSSTDFLHQSTFPINQLSSSINILHQFTFFIIWLSSWFNFLCQSSFLVNQLFIPIDLIYLLLDLLQLSRLSVLFSNFRSEITITNFGIKCHSPLLWSKDSFLSDPSEAPAPPPPSLGGRNHFSKQ